MLLVSEFIYIYLYALVCFHINPCVTSNILAMTDLRVCYNHNDFSTNLSVFQNQHRTITFSSYFGIHVLNKGLSAKFPANFDFTVKGFAINKPIIIFQFFDIIHLCSMVGCVLQKSALSPRFFRNILSQQPKIQALDSLHHMQSTVAIDWTPKLNDGWMQYNDAKIRIYCDGTASNTTQNR